MKRASPSTRLALLDVDEGSQGGLGLKAGEVVSAIGEISRGDSRVTLGWGEAGALHTVPC